MSYILGSLLILLWAILGQSTTFCPKALLVDCVLCVNTWTLDIKVGAPTYDARRAVSKCNAQVSELITYDLSPARASKSLQSRQFSLDFVDDFSFHSITSPHATISTYTIDVANGKADVNGNKQNSTATIKWVFSLLRNASINNVTFLLQYDVTGLVKTHKEHGYYIEWWPFMDNFALANSFLKNVSAAVTLPWGLASQGSQALNSTVGYNITTNMATQQIWSADNALVLFNVACYNAEFDGHFTLELEFDAHGVQCNKLPGWIIAVIVVACVLGTLMGCSFLAFVFFEKPYKCMESTEEVTRVRYYDDEEDPNRQGSMPFKSK